MGAKIKYGLLVLFTIGVLVVTALLLYTGDAPVLQPKGWIGVKELDLFNVISWLMLIIVVPVFIMTAYIPWKYRASNKKAKYDPKWDQSYLAEAIWWGAPFAVIIVAGALTWKACHELDPFRPIEGDTKPITIQVVALQWKWLFIYPEEKIATVNFVQFPEKTPIRFEVTADAPMNSFWIPHLGGQIYAMAGMRSLLHLIADVPGVYTGSSANLSGKGFSGMKFTAKASSSEEFEEWVSSVQSSTSSLGMGEYAELVKPSEYDPVSLYQLEDGDLFDRILMKYTMPTQ